MEKTYHRVRIESLGEPVYENQTHYVFDCPWCNEKVGPHSDGRPNHHLWVNKKTHVGFCFRCHSVVLPIQDEFYKKPYVNYDGRIEIKPVRIKYEEEITNSELINWIRNRSPYVLDILPLPSVGQVRTYEGYSIIFLSYIDGQIYYYQIRKKKGKPKYIGAVGTKVLYSPLGINTSERLKELTIVEGPFDALGAYYLGWEFPVAILGSTMTDVQKELIRILNPKIVNVMLDSVNLSQNLSKELTKIGVKSRIVELDSYDPDELATALWRKTYGRYQEVSRSGTGIG